MLPSVTCRAWEVASLISFAYVALTAAGLKRGVASPVRIRAVGASLAGIAVAVASSVAPPNVFLQVWLFPPVLLLLFYWTTGLLFVAPMNWVEATFLGIDRALHICDLTARTPRWLVEI